MVRPLNNQLAVLDGDGVGTQTLDSNHHVLLVGGARGGVDCRGLNWGRCWRKLLWGGRNWFRLDWRHIGISRNVRVPLDGVSLGWGGGGGDVRFRQ